MLRLFRLFLWLVNYMEERLRNFNCWIRILLIFRNIMGNIIRRLFRLRNIFRDLRNEFDCIFIYFIYKGIYHFRRSARFPSIGQHRILAIFLSGRSCPLRNSMGCWGQTWPTYRARSQCSSWYSPVWYDFRWARWTPNHHHWQLPHWQCSTKLPP